METVQETVREILETDIESRDNDIRLIRMVAEKKNWPTDIREIEKMTKKDIFGTITRARRKVQHNNPFLAASKETQEARAKREEEVKEWNRKL